jgi:hypothetical protein
MIFRYIYTDALIAFITAIVNFFIIFSIAYFWNEVSILSISGGVIAEIIFFLAFAYSSVKVNIRDKNIYISHFFGLYASVINISDIVEIKTTSCSSSSLWIFAVFKGKLYKPYFKYYSEALYLELKSGDKYLVSIPNLDLLTNRIISDASTQCRIK